MRTKKSLDVEYGSRNRLPNTLLRLRFVTHCTAQFLKTAKEQVVLLPKAYNHNPSKKVTLTTASSTDLTLLISSVMLWITN